MPKFVEGFAARITVPEGQRDILVFDSELPGFGIRKFASGRASYLVKYNVGSQQRRHTLGTVVHGNLKAMRLEASAILAKARLGNDVIAEKRVAAGRRIVTFGEIIPVYLHTRKGELRDRSYKGTERYLQHGWKPLHAMAVDGISRADVVRIVDVLERDSGKVAADRARTALSTFYAWAIDRGYVNSNPTIGIKSRSQNGPRKRMLAGDELLEVWKACGDDRYGRVVRLLILTGQRRAEIGGLSWPEVDLAKQQIDLPEHRTKNGRRHLIPLSDAALTLLPQPPEEGKGMLFSKTSGGFTGWSKGKLDLDAHLPEMPPWTVHDIRRSVVTGMNEIGVLPHIVEAVVNHVSGSRGGIAGTYNHAEYIDEKRRALQQWGEHIMALVERRDSKVVPMRAAQKVGAENQRQKAG
jgi:integrase